MEALKLESVMKQYGEKTAVNGINLTVGKGKFTDYWGQMVQGKQPQCAWCLA